MKRKKRTTKNKSLKKIRSRSKKKKVVMISGGFDPLHIGHIRYMQEAKKLGDKLIVVINNDNWLELKKGYAFMSENDRKEIIESISCVDEVYLTGHEKGTEDISVCNEIEKIRPHIFAKGGDRKPEGDPLPGPEVSLCNRLGIEVVYDVGQGGKLRSSSDLVKEATKKREKYGKK